MHNLTEGIAEASDIIGNPNKPGAAWVSEGWASPSGTGLSAPLKPRLAPGFPLSGSIPDAVFVASLDRVVTRRGR